MVAVLCSKEEEASLEDVDGRSRRYCVEELHADVVHQLLCAVHGNFVKISILTLQNEEEVVELECCA